MKVKSVSSTRSSSATRRVGTVGGAGASDFASLLAGQMEDAGTAEAAIAATGVNNIAGVLPTQNVGDQDEERGRRRRTVSYGDDLLNRLEDIRIAIIKGIVPKEKLFQLSQKLRTRNKAEIDSDPRLKMIIEDIETRVEVELAKLMRVSVTI